MKPHLFLLPLLTLHLTICLEWTASADDGPGGSGQPSASVYDVFKYGAKGDGKSNDREALQRAIDAFFKNITATSDLGSVACLVSGAPGKSVHDIHFSGLKFSFPGGTSAVPAIPAEYHGEYPEGTHFGDLPGYAFYVRHAGGVTFTNCEFNTKQPDARRWLATEDVRGLVCKDIKEAVATARH